MIKQNNKQMIPFQAEPYVSSIDTRMQDAVNAGTITMGAYLRHCAAQEGEPQTEVQIAFAVWSIAARSLAQKERYDAYLQDKDWVFPAIPCE